MSEDYQKKALRVSYLLSLGIALVAGLAFFMVTTLGSYSLLTRYGGGAWVILLSLIIALPTITPVMKRRYRR